MSDSSLVSGRNRPIVNTAPAAIYRLFLLQEDVPWLTILDVSRGQQGFGDELWRQVRVPVAVLPSCLTSARLQTSDLILRLPRSGTQIPSVGVDGSGSIGFDVVLSYPATSHPISLSLSRVSYRRYPGLPAKTHMGGGGVREDFNANRTESGHRKR